MFILLEYPFKRKDTYIIKTNGDLEVSLVPVSGEHKILLSILRIIGTSLCSQFTVIKKVVHVTESQNSYYG